MYFDRWCNPRNVDTDFEKLIKVILIKGMFMMTLKPICMNKK